MGPEWTLGVGDGQGGLGCCDSWGLKESDTTEFSELNWTEYFIVYMYLTASLSTLLLMKCQCSLFLFSLLIYKYHFIAVLQFKIFCSLLIFWSVFLYYFKNPFLFPYLVMGNVSPRWWEFKNESYYQLATSMDWKANHRSSDFIWMLPGLSSLTEGTVRDILLLASWPPGQFSLEE